ncbi:MAG: putative lipoprotein [Acidimicrobiales bacterium]|nr:putative lipoprotein [Acidimicrobiales bacterium]
MVPELTTDPDVHRGAAAPPTARASFGRPLAFFTAMTALLLVVQHVSNRVTRNPGYRFLPWQGWRFYLDGWSQFDGPEYQNIARDGYSYVAGETSNIVWFPLYPLLLRAVQRVTGDYLTAGIVVSFLGGAVAVVACWAWLGAVGMPDRRRRIAFAAVVLYPYGWYLYGAVHADSLFLGLAIAAFLFVERDQLVLAGVAGALATATRPTGMALVPGLMVFALTHHGVLRVPDDARGLRARFAIPTQLDLSRIRASTFGPWLVVVGIGSWMGFLWAKWGNPILFIINEREYHPGARPWLKAEFFYRCLHFTDNPTYAVTIVGQVLVLALMVWSIPAVCRRFGFAYGFFLAVLVAIPTLSTEDFMGTGRYLMAGFPVLALWGERIADRPLARRAWLGISGTLMVFMAALFSRSTYLT